LRPVLIQRIIGMKMLRTLFCFTKLKKKFKLAFLTNLFIIVLFTPSLYAQTDVKSDTLKNDSVKKKEVSVIEKQVIYSSKDSVMFDIGTQKVLLWNDSKVNYGTIELKASEVIFNLAKNVLHAKQTLDSTGNEVGRPEFKDGDQTFFSDSLSYNFKSKRGVVKGVKTEQGEGYLHSEITKKEKDGSICVYKGKYTTCDADHPHFYIALSKAKLIPNRQIISGPLHVVVADIPLPIGLPFGYFPNQKGAHSGILIPAYGDELNRGYFLKNGGFYFALNDYIDLALTGEIYSKGSWGTGIQSNYKRRYKRSGKLEFLYNSNVIGDKEDTINYSKSTAYWIKWNHTQDAKAKPNRTFSASVNMGSSNFQQYNSVRTSDYLSDQFNSSVSYARSFPGTPFNFSANLRQTQSSSTKEMNFSLPDLSFTMSRIFPFQRKNFVGKQKWYEKISLSYTSNFTNQITSKSLDIFDSTANWENGYKHSIPISASYKFLKFFTFTPSISYDGFVYANYLNKRYIDYDTLIVDTLRKEGIGVGYAHTMGPSFSLTFNPKLYGFYISKNPNWRVKAIRHVMTPSASLSFSPDMGLNTKQYFRQDSAFDEYGVQRLYKYSIYDHGVYGPPRERKKGGSINFALDNNLEAKIKAPSDTSEAGRKVKILEQCGIRTSYNIFEDSMKWDYLSFNIATDLFNMFDISSSGSFSEYQVDSIGTEIDRFNWEDPGNKILRLKSVNFSIGFSIASTIFKQEKKSGEKKNQNDPQRFNDGMTNDINPDLNTDAPWDLRVDFQVNYSKVFNRESQRFDEQKTPTLNVSGSLKITPQWGVRCRTGWDFTNKDFSYTDLSIDRDLHCWAMRLSLVPFGQRKSYYFTLNAKSSMLKDVKYEKRKSFFDNIYETQ